MNRRSFSRREAPLLKHQQIIPSNGNSHGGSSHAEIFYLQKQMQAQTPMVFMLEDGEHLEGVIEWYDAHAIKIRHGHIRTLIYKSAIKYLHKAAESQPPI